MSEKSELKFGTNPNELTFLHAKFKGMYIALIVLSAVFLPIMGFQIYTAGIQPKYYTSVYHFNAEYRAGLYDDTLNVLHEDVIIGQAIPAVVAMFDKHPDWKWTLELQGYAIEKMQSLNKTGFEMLRDQVNRGQCELISVFYSYELVVAHPLNLTWEDIVYNRELLKSLGFTRFSESVFFQESQTLPGFGMLNKPLYDKYGIRFRNLLISSATLSLYHFDVNTPMYKYEPFGDPDLGFNYIVYNYLPQYAAGAFQIWTWVAPGETISGKNDWTTQGANAYFSPYPPNIEWHETRLKKLEESGYKSLTIDEWADICEEKHSYKVMNTFLPETTWRASDSRSIFTWMGLNKHYGNDDGNQLAQIYRVYHYTRGVQLLYDSKRTLLSSIDGNLTSKIRENITLAWRNLFKATATDAVGWRPDLEEANYSRNHCELAMSYLTSSLKTMKSMLGISSPVQAVLFNDSILTSDYVKAVNLTDQSSRGLSLDDLPVKVSIQTESFDYSYSVSNMSYLGVNYLSLDVYANLTIRSEKEPFYISFKPKDDGSSLYPIKYCPTLMENHLQEFNYDDIGEPLYLPLSNGLFILNGVPIIKNCSARHVSLKVDEDSQGFYEEGNNYEPIHYQILFPMDLADAEIESAAIDFANKINTRGVVMLG